MTEQPEKQGNKRLPNGRFPKGVSGNPNGRPKKKGSIIEILEQMIEEQAPGTDETFKTMIARNILLTILDRRDKNHVELLKEALNRLYGKAKESVEISGGKTPVVVEYVAARKRETSEDTG